ncbi:AcrR family transcriptional regulator [Algoriphagus iocasae]|uniref:AcrR family transcriptional regulator n=1 Tax=Algoriphagus iocasae TaxID=1836499 RepID=A0A841ML26_9BACT|nr:TetR family transcriptional regulator [Algoriphagus iocasae]MBB6328982.1 AcrR family transcriptional regulator [Algoriphagus iocasae]
MPQKLTKGKKTKETILNEARQIFNENGIFLTLNELSKIIGITIGGITNHFPTKDHLFVGMAEVYESDLESINSNQDYFTDLSFRKVYQYFGNILDTQYNHRSVILFFSAAHQSQKVLLTQVASTWSKRQERIEKLFYLFVKEGLLREEILQPKEFSVIGFQFVNLFTTWLVSYTLYDNEKPYSEMKNVYLIGIFRLFEHYLTEKGRSQLEALKLL